MVWHIFKKDWKLLWPLGIAAVVLQAIQEALVFRIGLFRNGGPLMQLENAASLLLLLAWIFAIGLAVFQDAIPGVKQDWLARPIRRRDLLGAKFLFAATFVLAPFFAAALFEGLGHGFAFGATLGVAIRATVWMALGFVLPVVAATSLFKSVSQGIITVVVTYACMMLISLFMNFGSAFRGYAPRFASISSGGLGWMLELLGFLILLCGTVVVLFMQFGRRRTRASFGVAVAVIVLSYLTGLVPWGPAFALEKRLSPNPGAGREIEMAFDTSATPTPNSSRDLHGLRAAPANSDLEVAIPMEVTGIAGDRVLITDRVGVQLIRPDGVRLRTGWTAGWTVWQGPQPVTRSSYLEVGVPASAYLSARDADVRAEADYSLTLFRLKASYAIPAVNGDERMPGLGWCETRVGPFGGMVEVSCMELGQSAACKGSFLENTETGERNPLVDGCGRNYSPGALGSEMMGRASWRLDTYNDRDPRDERAYPVDASKLEKAQVVIRVYAPEEHFSRHVVIPHLKLSDWASWARPSGPPQLVVAKPAGKPQTPAKKR